MFVFPAGCLADVNCPQSYECLSGVCRSSPGKVLLQSVNIKTEQCEGCEGRGAGVRLSLRGEFIGEFINGTPCSTNLLHHEDSVTTFLTGQVATWTGMLEGEEEQEEQEKLGACYKAPLNAQVTQWYTPALRFFQFFNAIKKQLKPPKA